MLERLDETQSILVYLRASLSKKNHRRLSTAPKKFASRIATYGFFLGAETEIDEEEAYTFKKKNVNNNSTNELLLQFY
ncbi:hypothetical protein DY000_02028470 [Brassica cretica]|uniref:Uncharacterized protein n=1 Tax=Brassica cretica TaxID=69181 RepID=A0ABQ7DJK5_BRACR|nr:hypothetical protein DY000_02028470 [Brassica cretica]